MCDKKNHYLLEYLDQAIKDNTKSRDNGGKGIRTIVYSSNVNVLETIARYLQLHHSFKMGILKDVSEEFSMDAFHQAHQSYNIGDIDFIGITEIPLSGLTFANTDNVIFFEEPSIDLFECKLLMNIYRNRLDTKAKSRIVVKKYYYTHKGYDSYDFEQSLFNTSRFIIHLLFWTLVYSKRSTIK
jgi:hypothetical protein